MSSTVIKILRHTGGRTASHPPSTDLDAGVAAFASINAMQGYRPTAVTQYAVQLLRAKREVLPLAAEPVADPAEVDNAGEYAGMFQSA